MVLEKNFFSKLLFKKLSFIWIWNKKKPDQIIEPRKSNKSSIQDWSILTTTTIMVIVIIHDHKPYTTTGFPYNTFATDLDARCGLYLLAYLRYFYNFMEILYVYSAAHTRLYYSTLIKIIYYNIILIRCEIKHKSWRINFYYFLFVKNIIITT